MIEICATLTFSHVGSVEIAGEIQEILDLVAITKILSKITTIWCKE